MTYPSIKGRGKSWERSMLAAPRDDIMTDSKLIQNMAYEETKNGEQIEHVG